MQRVWGSFYKNALYKFTVITVIIISIAVLSVCRFGIIVIVGSPRQSVGYGLWLHLTNMKNISAGLYANRSRT